MGKAVVRAGMLGLSLLAAWGCSGSSKSQPEPSKSCEAGQRRCDGLDVKRCNADGTAEAIESTCLPSQSCNGGQCHDTTCVPLTKFCKAGAIWKCDATGESSTLADTCASGFFCREDEDDASCSTQACTAGQPLCAGSVATVCEADGSGPKTGGTDCAASDRACYDGQCRERACVGGSRVCQNGDVYLCAENGTATSLLVECSDGQVCDADAGACRPKVCDSGKVTCDGSRVVTCNAFGSAWLPSATDCAADSKVCVDGSCKKQLCVPNSTFCQDGSVFSCGATGATTTLYQTCNTTYQHCVAYPSYAYCQSKDCRAGEKLCVDNLVKVCSEDDTLPPDGTPCGETNYCDDGQCKPRDCPVLDQYLCRDGDIYYCNYFGASLQQTCGDQTACLETNGGATCVPLPCEPGTKTCIGNKLGLCGTDGNTLGSVSEDCGAGGNVCTAALGCAKTAVDMLGVAENIEGIGDQTLIGDVVNVTSSRKLTEIAANLVLATPRELRWVVFELSGQSFVARLDKLVTTPASAGSVSSGAFEYSLKAGKSYLFGVVIGSGDAVAYNDTAPFQHNASFGSVTGRVGTYYQSTIDIGNVYTEGVYQMTLSTTAP